MNAGDQLEELRIRVIHILLGLTITVVGSLIFGNDIIELMKKPYVDVMKDAGLEPSLQTITPTDGFTTYVRICLMTGITIAAPWIFYQLWQFVAVGLYPNEKKYLFRAAPASTVLFIAGVVFFVMVVAPFSLRFFIMFNSNVLGIISVFTFQSYISYILSLMLVFGFSFQLPVATYFLVNVGLVSIRALHKSRKYVLVSVFILATIITPPDVVSQVTLAVPLYLLFELGILCSYNTNTKIKINLKAMPSSHGIDSN